jgi:hypothetical protein
MWLFTRYGFYSIACAYRPDGSPDPETVMIRARCREHLCALQQRFTALADFNVQDTPGRDYAHRLILPKRVWAGVLSELATEQEWSNFKDEVAEFQGQAGRKYVRALHDVWTRMARFQATEPVRHDRVVRNTERIIMNAEELTAADLANEKVLCPACGQKVFAAWPEGWDGHAGWACAIDGITPEERKANYKRRFRRLFR